MNINFNESEIKHICELLHKDIKSIDNVNDFKSLELINKIWNSEIYYIENIRLNIVSKEV